jgi:hypothetical protein
MPWGAPFGSAEELDDDTLDDEAVDEREGPGRRACSTLTLPHVFPFR